MSGFHNVTFGDESSFGTKKGRITLTHTEINKKTKVNAYYTNNTVVAEAIISSGTLSYTYHLPKGASIKEQTVTSKAKDRCMRVYFNKLTDFDLEETSANQETKSSDSDSL